MEITKSHLNNNPICQHCGVKTSMVTPSFYYVFNIALSCNNNVPSFIGNLWRVLLLGTQLNGHGNYRELSRNGLLMDSVRAVRVRTPVIMLCYLPKHFFHTVSLSTSAYKWIPGNLMLGITLEILLVSVRLEDRLNLNYYDKFLPVRVLYAFLHR